MEIFNFTNMCSNTVWHCHFIHQTVPMGTFKHYSQFLLLLLSYVKLTAHYRTLQRDFCDLVSSFRHTVESNNKEPPIKKNQ